MGYPEHRLRRLRRTESLRNMIRETRLHPSDFILPLFIVEGSGRVEEISSMPGVFRYSVDKLDTIIKETENCNVPAVILFGIPGNKDAIGSSSWKKDGVIQRAIEKIKDITPGLTVITDVCMCEYTDHGHCGVIVKNEVDNDATLELLARQALSHIRAGADMVAPSDMMDGRVGAIRKALDEIGCTHIPVMAYSAKFASAFYGPFRDAAESAPQFGDRRGYQMDPPNAGEALREIELDIEEGADIVMVKPALSYLDVITRAKQEFNLPLAAYNVSGEYSMVKAAGKAGYIDESRVMMEILTSIKRAGADMILTYFAIDAAKLL